MAAFAAKAMGAAPVKEKQALLENRRQQAKKAKSLLVGSSSRSVTSEHAEENRSLDVEGSTQVEGNTNEGAVNRPDGAMEQCVGRLALQASSSIDGIGGEANAERAVGINHDEASQSKFCIRQYTEKVRQDRGDLKRSWPLAEEYLRGHICQGRVQASLWPPIDAGESALSQAYRSSFHMLDGPLPHLCKLEIAFAESGLSEEKLDQSWISAEEVGVAKRVGSRVVCSSDFVERRPSEEGNCTARTKSSKAGRKISSSTDCSGDSQAQEREEKQDRSIRDSEAKHVGQRTASIVCVVERGANQVRGDVTAIQVKDTGSPRTEPAGSVDTGKVRRVPDNTPSHAFHAKKTVDKTCRAQYLVENVAEIGERATGVGKVVGAGNSGAEVEGGPSSIRINTHVGDSDNPKRGERDVADGHAIQKESLVPKRRIEDDRIVEERSAKSEGASASRPSTKRQSNKACPVCRSFSSMSQTTMNVHIDSCLVEHRQEDQGGDGDPVESEPEPEASHEPPSRSKPVKFKGPGLKPKRKKRSIADIVANSVIRTLEESPGKESVRFQSPCSRSIDQVHDSKNLNWVSGNKKKRQPRNVPSRNVRDENDSKRRRISRAESVAEEPKPGKQEKRRLPEKEREGTTNPKQSRVERCTTLGTSNTKSFEVQEGVETEFRRSAARKTGGATPKSLLPSARSGSGKGHIFLSNKESSERDVSHSVGVSQSRETRTSSARGDLPMEQDEIPAENLDITLPRRSQTSAQKSPAPAAAKPRAAKMHANSGSGGRLDSPLISTDRAPKAPWYPPAAMLHSGTIPPAAVTQPAGSIPLPEITCGTMKGPGTSLTAENLSGTFRTAPTTGTSGSTRTSPRSTPSNSCKGQKGSRALAGESPLTTDATDEAKVGTSDPSHKHSAQVDVQNMAECRISKEFDYYSDQSEAAVGGMPRMIQYSLNNRRDFRAVSVESPRQPPPTETETDLISEGVVYQVAGKSQGVHSKKQQAAAEQRREGRKGSVVAEEDIITVVPTAIDVTELDQDPSIRTLPEGCRTDACGDTQTVNVGVAKTRESVVSRVSKRDGSKVKSRSFSEKSNGRGRRASEDNAGQVDEIRGKRQLPNTAVTEGTSIEENQLDEDKLKEEHQRKGNRQQLVDTSLQPMFKWNSEPVEPAFQDMVVRRIEGVMGQEKGVDLVTSRTNNVASPSSDQEKSKEEQFNLARVQADSTHKVQLQKPEDTLHNIAQLRLGRDTEVSTSSSQIKQLTSQVEDGVAKAQVAIEDVVQGQSPHTWSLVPQRPIGRKKLPIKCAARSVGSASAAKQASGTAWKSNASSQEAKLVESFGAGPEKGSSTSDVRTADNTGSPVTVLKPPVSRSRAARQLAKSLPAGKKGGGVLSPEGQPLTSGIAVSCSNAKEKSDNGGSTPSQQALLSPSPSWRTNPVRGQLSVSTSTERVSTVTFAPKSATSEATRDQNKECEGVACDGAPVSAEKGSGAHGAPVSDELHYTENLFCSQTNAESNVHMRSSIEATKHQLKDKGSSNAEVVEDTESGTNVREKHSSESDASVTRLPVSQQLESGFSARRGHDQNGLDTTLASNVHKLNDKDSRGSEKACNQESSLSGTFSPSVAESQRSGISGMSPGKVVKVTEHGKPDTSGSFQTLEPGPATITSGSGISNVRLSSVVSKVASSTGLNTQLAQVRQNSSNPMVASTRVSCYRLNATATDAGSFEVANIRPFMTTTAPLPTSFTRLLQSTTLPPQSSAALSLAMQGTRPLQEACADRNELSRAGVSLSTRVVTDPQRRNVDGLTWGSEKHAPSGKDILMSSHVPAGTAFFRPPPEMGGLSKGSEAGNKEISRLPGWMRAAISDPKGSEAGHFVTTEAEEYSLNEAVKELRANPEGGETSGPVRVRLWGRDVVVPPNEKGKTGSPPTQQGAHGHKNEAQRGAVTGSETVASCRTSTACLDGVTVNSQASLKVNLGPAPPRVGQGVTKTSHQIIVPVMGNPNSETRVVGSTESVSVFGQLNNHQAENYLSRLDFNSRRSSNTASSREEIRSSRASKGQTSAAQSTISPEVIIIDDSAESPAKSGDSFSGEGLTMAFLLDCGALRYLPATQNGRSGSQLMEVDPSKIPQRLVNQNFNILAELRKIGLVPAPKAVLPASYRHSHSLSVEVPHSSPPPASRAGSDVLPPWLLAEKKRKEAQIAENLIVLDDDDEPPTGTVILGERRPLNSRALPGSSSNLSEQRQSAGQASSSTLGKSGSEARVVEHSTGTLRTSAMSTMAPTVIPAPGRQSPATSHASVHLRRATSSAPHGKDSPAPQKSLSTKNDDVVGGLARLAVDKEHLNANTASESQIKGRGGLQSPAASKEQSGGVQAASGPTPPLRQREDDRTDKEKQMQVSDLQNEKKSPKAGCGAHKSSPPAAVLGGLGGPLLKKGSGQGISILAPTWMSGNNGWPKRGAAAQACKQAVERLKAQILSGPARDGTSHSGPGGLRDFESHMIGQAQEKYTSFEGNLSGAASRLQNLSSQAIQGGGFRYSSLSSRSGGDQQNICSSKEAPQSGRAVGQSPTPGTFTSAVMAAERDFSSVSKSVGIPSVAVHSMMGVQGGAPVVEANQSQSSNSGSRSLAPSGSIVVDGKMSIPVVQSTAAREPSSSEQSSPTYSHLVRSSSSSPTLRSRAVVGAKAVDECSNAILAREAMQSEHGSFGPAQGTPVSRLLSSRLTLPVHGASTKALLEQVCFTSKAAADSFTREVSNLQATREQSTGRMTSPQKRVQPPRLKNVSPINGGERTTANPVAVVLSALTPVTIITSNSSAQSRPAHGFPTSCSPSTSSTDQRRQLESEIIGAVNRSDGIPLVAGQNVSGTEASRSPTSDLPLSSVFERLSQASNSSASSSQGRYTASCAAIIPCDGGTWTSSGHTDAVDQASGTGLSDHTPGSRIIPDYRVAPQTTRTIVGQTQRPRATNPSTTVNGGFFPSVERSSNQKESDVSPRSKDSDTSGISAHERYSHTRDTREEKVKDAQRVSPKSTTTGTTEKVTKGECQSKAVSTSTYRRFEPRTPYDEYPWGGDSSRTFKYPGRQGCQLSSSRSSKRRCCSLIRGVFEVTTMPKTVSASPLLPPG